MKVSNLIILLCGAVLLHSCRENANYEALDKTTSDTTLVQADSLSPGEAKLVKNADMSFKVKNVSQAGEQISALTKQYKGMVMNHHMRSTVEQVRDVALSNDSVMRVTAFSTSADMSVKVPARYADEFMNKVSHMGLYVTARNMDIEDKTLTYLESQLKLNSRQELVNQQQKGRIKLKHAEDVLIFKDALVDEQISNKRIDEAVKYTVLGLSFSQNNTVLKEVLPVTDPEAYRLPFINRLQLALVNGVAIFADVIVALANMWLIAILLIGLWLVYRYYRKKHPVLFTDKAPVKSAV